MSFKDPKVGHSDQDKDRTLRHPMICYHTMFGDRAANDMLYILQRRA